MNKVASFLLYAFVAFTIGFGVAMCVADASESRYYEVKKWAGEGMVGYHGWYGGPDFNYELRSYCTRDKSPGHMVVMVDHMSPSAGVVHILNVSLSLEMREGHTSIEQAEEMVRFYKATCGNFKVEEFD